MFSPEDVVVLEMTIRGRVVIPDNTREYQEQVQREHNACFWNAKPLFFVLCHDTGDVVAAIKFVTDHDVPLCIRSGGHSVCGSSLRDGCVVIDLGRMRGMDYDPATGRVTMDVGCTLADVNVGLLRKGRMAPVGTVPSTGVGGLCLHGGIGFLQHRYGTSVDNITDMEIVLADGTVKHLNRDSTGDDKELFFAARGAAGTVGIVTKFTMQTYPMEAVTGGVWLMLDDANYTHSREIIKKARDLVEEQEKAGDRKFMGVIVTYNVPPDPTIPEELHGKPATLLLASVWGDEEAAFDMIQPFCDREVLFGKPPSPMPWNMFNQLFSGMLLNWPPVGLYWKGNFVASLHDDKLDVMIDGYVGHEPELNMSFVGVEFHGGKAGVEHAKKMNEGNDHCVSALRTFTYSIPSLMYFTSEPGVYEKGKALAQKLHSVMQKDSISCYANYLSDLGTNAEKQLYDELMISNKQRLYDIKQKVDPKNIFTRSVISASK